MGTAVRLFLRSVILLVLACSLGPLSGCIVVNTSGSDGKEVRRSVSKIWPFRKASENVREEPPSVKGSASEFGRGVTNVALCWLELPYELENGIRDGSKPGIGGLFHTAWNIVGGTVKGTLGTAGRAVGGVLEVAFSPFPPYNPLMQPAFPPYLNFLAKEKPDSEKSEKAQP